MDSSTRDEWGDRAKAKKRALDRQRRAEWAASPRVQELKRMLKARAKETRERITRENKARRRLRAELDRTQRHDEPREQHVPAERSEPRS